MIKKVKCGEPTSNGSTENKPLLPQDIHNAPVMEKGAGEIILYQPNETLAIEVKLDVDHNTVWLTQQQIAELFGTKRPAISKHLNNIYQSGELDKMSTCSILEHMGNDGKQRYTTAYYNLDAIISVGYRVNSINATFFRRWATNILKDYLIKGYSLNQQLLSIQRQIDSRFEDQSLRICQLEKQAGKTARTT